MQAFTSLAEHQQQENTRKYIFQYTYLATQCRLSRFTLYHDQITISAGGARKITLEAAALECRELPVPASHNQLAVPLTVV